ncbi:hypothetical protein ACOME3_008172 [Neoechinorhynchus agilis]
MGNSLAIIFLDDLERYSIFPHQASSQISLRYVDDALFTYREENETNDVESRLNLMDSAGRIRVTRDSPVDNLPLLNLCFNANDINAYSWYRKPCKKEINELLAQNGYSGQEIRRLKLRSEKASQRIVDDLERNRQKAHSEDSIRCCGEQDRMFAWFIGASNHDEDGGHHEAPSSCPSACKMC